MVNLSLNERNLTTLFRHEINALSFGGVCTFWYTGSMVMHPEVHLSLIDSEQPASSGAINPLECKELTAYVLFFHSLASFLQNKLIEVGAQPAKNEQ
jgi:hypothetical protein